MSTQQVSEPIKQVPSEITKLSQEIGKALAELGELEDRLDYVRKEPSVLPKGEAQPEDPLVPLAQELRALRHDVEAITYRLVDLMQTLQL